MSKYRQNLPQLGDRLFLTDGGMETTFVFHHGLDLPCFAAFTLMKSEEGRSRIRDYYESYARIAVHARAGFILESPTWRANADWGRQLGYSDGELAEANRACIALLADLRETYETEASPMPISGNIGPRGDGYRPGEIMSVREAQDYHGEQIATFRTTAADFVSAFTINNIPEAAGIARAAETAGLPCVISFTVETDGRLPSGDALGHAIAAVDGSCTRAPAYFMINCAHPSHFAPTLTEGGGWVKRIRGIRANSSRCSHAELDNASELDTGNPVELARDYHELLVRYSHINVIGGCCGTDQRHIEEVARACFATT